MTFTITLSNNQINKIISQYECNRNDSNVTNNYTLFRAKIKSTTLTIFKTGKLLLQGNDIIPVQNEIEQLLNLKPSLNIKANTKIISIGKNIIGTDEVGTGDYFGGIVVCASLVEKDKILGKYLIENIKHTVLLLNNKKYNQIYSKTMNLNKIKAILHNKVILNFLNKYPNTNFDKIVIDSFCQTNKYFEYLENINETYKTVELIEKAENKYISVAASSIIARYYFLKHLEDLSKETGYNLIKGASKQVDKLAYKIINEKGLDFLYNIAKINFKNTLKAKEDNNA